VEADALGEELDELAGVLGRLAPADWDRPTRCEGWDVTDVVLHLAQTNEMAMASYSGRYAEVGAGLSAGLAPGRARGGGTDPTTRVPKDPNSRAERGARSFAQHLHIHALC
jgi:uncharacterized protein (TIGR03083 family)